MWGLFIQQLQSGRTEEKFIFTEVLRLLLINSYKFLLALDFKMMLEYYIIYSCCKWEQQYLPSSHSVWERKCKKLYSQSQGAKQVPQVLCVKQVYGFMHLKKKRNGAVKKNTFLFLFCASCLTLVHKYCIHPLKFSFLFITTLIMLHLYSFSPAKGLI